LHTGFKPAGNTVLLRPPGPIHPAANTPEEETAAVPSRDAEKLGSQGASSIQAAKRAAVPKLFFEVLPERSGYLYHHARWAVIWAMLANFTICAIKFAGFFFVTPSAALLSEALHSLGDGINSITLWVGLVRGNRPPDRTHPFGYGLETNFWALFASFFLFVSAGYAVWSGVQRFLHPEPLEHLGLVMAILVISIVVELLAVRTAARAVLEEVGLPSQGWSDINRAFQNIKHVVAPTTRFVFYEDALALLGALFVLMAIVVTQFSISFGWLSEAYLSWPDAIASIAVGLVLLTLAINLLRYNRGFLIGSAAPEPVEQKIQDVVMSLHGVSQLVDLKTIDQGLAGTIVHMKVEVEPDTMVRDVDDLTEHIKSKVQQRVPSVRQVFIEVLADETELTWEEQFQQLIIQGHKDAVLTSREETMLRRVVEFKDAVARDIMVPRTDVEYVDIQTSLSTLADLMIETGHTRVPVYEDHVDNLVGLVTSRDVFAKLRSNALDTPLSSILLPLEIYPENKPVTDLLEDFKRKKMKLAVVADEHGGFSGVVTIQDLLEEIVGEIGDAHGPEEAQLQRLDDYQLRVSGKYDIEDLNERYGFAFPVDEFKTLGGFVFGLLGREPEAGDAVTFEDLTLRVETVEGPRITSVIIASPAVLPSTPGES
jgi:cation diffusion facilitator family transporter